jgi:acetylglutamate synthase
MLLHRFHYKLNCKTNFFLIEKKRKLFLKEGRKEEENSRLKNHDLFVKQIRSNRVSRVSREIEKREIKPQALCMSVFSDDQFVCMICCNRILAPHSNNWRRRRSSKLSLF